MKIDWDKVTWSWPVMLINTICFGAMIMIFGKGCAEDRQRQHKEEVQQIMEEIKSDSCNKGCK